MNIDMIIEEAIRLCLKNSLTIVFEALHGVNTAGPSLVLLIQANIIDNKVCS